MKFSNGERVRERGCERGRKSKRKERERVEKGDKREKDEKEFGNWCKSHTQVMQCFEQ